MSESFTIEVNISFYSGGGDGSMKLAKIRVIASSSHGIEVMDEVDRLTSSRPLHFFQADNSILLEKHIKSFGAPRVRFQSYSSSEHFDKLRSFLLPKSAEHGGGQWIGIAGDTRGAVVLYVPTSDAANSVWGLVWDTGDINQAINKFKRVLRKSAEQPEEWLQADGREQGL